ncbi:hypothetical protein BKA82DRAFT_4229409 [Pisolithus tinctorius]|nr:hypothetical protein BKA82DRAFT_4229409 [Pisolithus tinctorius]
MPTNVFRVPPASERLPFDTYTFFAYILPPCLAYHVVALLVILPGTRMLRIALWPLIALLAFRAAMYVDLTGGNPQRTFLNVDFALVMTHSNGTSDLLVPHHPLLMDALDLSTNMRGVGWNWSKSLRFPPDKRPTSRPWLIISVFLSCFLAVRAFSPETFTQDPAQWPPVFYEPWNADSLRDFWGYRWHQLLRRTFIVVGGWSLGSLFGYVGFVAGTFIGSGIYHNIVVIMINQNVEWWCMTLSFGMMGVGVILELMFTRVTGRRAWTTAWLLVWGNVMVDGLARAGMFASAGAFGTAAPARGIVEHYATAFDRWLRACGS